MRLLVGTFAIFCGLMLPAASQVLPNHFDPSTRPNASDMSNISTLRFLTTADFPPFNYRDAAGELVGFNVDLARAICDMLSATCTIQAWPWAQAADALDENQGDALISGIALDATNAARFDFSDIYLKFPARFVTPAAQAAQFDPRQLAGKKIAVRSGSRHADFLARYLPNAIPVPEASEFAALDLLREGKVDAYFGDGLRAAFWLNQNPDCCAFAGGAYFNPNYFGEGLAIAVSAGHSVVRTTINAALRELKKSGKLDEFYLRWFPVGFY